MAPAPYAWAALSAGLLCAERILAVNVAVRLVLHTRTDAFIAMGVLAAIFSLRAAVRGTLRARARKLVHTAAHPSYCRLQPDQESNGDT